jgi:copper chaperone
MLRLKIENMTCGGCAAAIRNAIARVAGSAEVKVDLGRKEVEVTGGADAGAIRAAVVAAGYKIAGADPAKG